MKAAAAVYASMTIVRISLYLYILLTHRSAATIVATLSRVALSHFDKVSLVLLTELLRLISPHLKLVGHSLTYT